MRTHILIGLLALISVSCASKRDVASTQDEQFTEQTQHAQMIDTAASARGNSVR